MLRSIRNVIVLLPLLAAVLLRCGSLSNSPTIAGGTGAGNPGGGGGGGTTAAVAVSISVNFVPMLMKTAAYADAATTMVILDSSRSITTKDKNNLPITITSITLSNFNIHFSLDSTQDPATLINKVPHNNYRLQADSNSIFVNWPHPFNALNADTVADSSLVLPIAPYRGMTLDFQPFDFGRHDRDTSKNNMVLSGFFTYSGQVHNLTIRVAFPHFNYTQKYPFAGGMFTLSNADTTHLQLQFDPGKWFSHLDLGDAIEDNWLWFDNNHNLTIDNLSYYPSFSGIGTGIATDFLASGKLVVY